MLTQNGIGKSGVGFEILGENKRSTVIILLRLCLVETQKFTDRCGNWQGPGVEPYEHLNQRRTICPREARADTWIDIPYRLSTEALTLPEQKHHQTVCKLERSPAEQSNFSAEGKFISLRNIYHWTENCNHHLFTLHVSTQSSIPRNNLSASKKLISQRW